MILLLRQQLRHEHNPISSGVSGPPRISFTWRHWSHWTGPYKNRTPTGELIELFGAAFVNLNTDSKIQTVEIYYDPGAMIRRLMGTSKL